MENVPWKQAIKEDVKQFECLETFYEDDLYEYKNLTLADIILKNFPLVKLLEEHELRAMGIRQSPTWVHYANREPDVMLFRRPRRDNREETKNQQKQDEEPPAEEGDTKKKKDENWRDAIPLIQYSVKYYDDNYEYRHVILPEIIVKTFPLVKLMEENEWRAMGVQQSRGWLHYAIHRPEPHIMLFRRPPQQKNTE